MTRTQFDSRFAATRSNTEGYTDAQLASINDAVFAKLGHLDAHDEDTVEILQNEFERAFVVADAAA